MTGPAIVTGGGAEAGKAVARAFMRSTPDGRHYCVAECVYRGRLFRSEVPILPGDNGNMAALQSALEDVRKQARAVQLTDFFDMGRVR